MQFTVEFYVSQSGQIPVQKFPEELRQTDPDDFAAVVRGLAKLRVPPRAAVEINRRRFVRVTPCREAEHTRPVVFMKGRRIVAVHGIRSKGQAIARRDFETARARMRDWEQRYE
jgi:hypothetical protein